MLNLRMNLPLIDEPLINQRTELELFSLMIFTDLFSIRKSSKIIQLLIP